MCAVTPKYFLFVKCGLSSICLLISFLLSCGLIITPPPITSSSAIGEKNSMVNFPNASCADGGSLFSVYFRPSLFGRVSFYPNPLVLLPAPIVGDGRYSRSVAFVAYSLLSGFADFSYVCRYVVFSGLAPLVPKFL